jgi:hypothetical protein
MVVPGRRGAHHFTLSRDGIRAVWVVIRNPYYTCPTVGEVRTALVSILNGGEALEAGNPVVSRFC